MSRTPVDNLKVKGQQSKVILSRGLRARRILRFSVPAGSVTLEANILSPRLYVRGCLWVDVHTAAACGLIMARWAF